MSAAILVALMPTQSMAADAPPRAVLEGLSIPLSSVASYHCHDEGWPVISCFRSSAERDDDLASPSRGSLAATQYVTVYADEDYGGGSFTAAYSYGNLGIIGWNNAITSFASLNGQRPKFWDSTDYGLPAWQWSAGGAVPNVGQGANDRFSSMRNVP